MSKTILLENGQIKKIGDTKDVVAYYLQSNPLTADGINLKIRKDRKGGEKIKIVSFHIEENGKKVDGLITGGNYTFCYSYESVDDKPIRNLSCSSCITLESGESLILVWNKFTQQEFKLAPPKGTIKCKINQKFPLGEGLYNIDVGLWANNKREDYLKNLLTLEVKKGNFYNNDFPVKHSPIHLEQSWELCK